MKDENAIIIKHTKLQRSLIYGAAGLFGNFASGVVYPLELIKIRLQVDENNKGLKQIIKEIFNKEGIRGFYRGFYYTTCASGISWGLFFIFLEYFNTVFNNKGKDYSSKKQMALSYFSGLITSLITMPMWTLRIRISLLTLDKTESSHLKSRMSFFYLVIRESIQKEGFLGLYKGFFSSIILPLHGGIQMTIYESSKRWVLTRNNRSEIKNYEGSILGVISKMCALFLLYPFNLIRAKQQQFTQVAQRKLNEDLKRHMVTSKSEYGQFSNTVKTVYTSNGVKGFYRGLTPGLFRQIPGSYLFFYTYEYTLKLFKIKQ